MHPFANHPGPSGPLHPADRESWPADRGERTKTVRFRRYPKVLREHCEAIGRDPDEIVLSHQYRLDAGDYGAAVEPLKRFIDAGATHLVLYLPSPHEKGMATRAAEEVVAKIQPQPRADVRGDRQGKPIPS